MKALKMHRKLLLAGALSLVLAPAAGWAQSASDDARQPGGGADGVMDVIEVTGIRGSLSRSLDLKRSSGTIQDSISALELGKFPDDNVADSLAHITGVSISRTAGGDGQKVSIRGLGPEYTLTTFNGRILATDGAGRDFAFDVLPADVISGADVIKGAQASNTEGAVGGLINLRSASPFDQTGQRGLVWLEGDRNTLSDYNGRKFSATYSNTFADDTFGLLVGAVYSERKDRTDVAGNDGGWTRNPDPTDESWLWGNAWGGNIDPNNNGVLDEDEYGLIGPGQFRVGAILEDKKRSALSAKLEWRPTDNIRLTVDGLETTLDTPQVGYQQSYYTLFAPGRWTDMTIENGIVTGFTLESDDPELMLNPELLNLTEYRVVDTDLYGFNAEWDVNESLTLMGDIYRSTSKRHSGGQDTYVVLRMNQPNVTRVELNGADVPDVWTQFDDGRELASGLENGEFGASDFNTHYMSLAGDNIDDRIDGATLAGDFVVDAYNVRNILFGVTLTDRKKSRDLVSNSLTGGADYYSGANAINVGDLEAGTIGRVLALPGYMSDVHASFPRTFLAFDVPSYLQALEAYDGNLRPDGSPYDYSAAAPEWNPLQSYRVSEETTALFVQANLEGERWDADVGLRWVTTSTSAQAWDAQIMSITENGPFNYTAHYADPTEIVQEGDYDYLLPAANFAWHFTDDLKLRLGAARTMARPPVEQLAPTNTTESVSWGEFTQVFGGNVDLKPYTADQADASLEWYFSESSIFNVAAFYKRIENQITTSWEPNQDIGVPGYLFNIIRPINGDYAKVKGVEAGFQYFWNNGFTVRAQYTRTWSKSYVDGEERPLEGIAPAVYSFGAWWESGQWSVGANADHTDGFVTAINVLGAGYDEEADPITWVSAHLAYDVNDTFTVSLQGNNLLDAENTYSINGNPLLPQGYYRYGRSFNLAVSMAFQ